MYNYLGIITSISGYHTTLFCNYEDLNHDKNLKINIEIIYVGHFFFSKIAPLFICWSSTENGKKNHFSTKGCRLIKLYTLLQL